MLALEDAAHDGAAYMLEHKSQKVERIEKDGMLEVEHGRPRMDAGWLPNWTTWTLMANVVGHDTLTLINAF